MTTELPSELINLTATILSTRSHRRFAFADLEVQGQTDAEPDDALSILSNPLQAVLEEKSQFVIAGYDVTFKDALEHFQSGAVVAIEGKLGKTKIGTKSIFVIRVELLRASSDPGRIMRLLLAADMESFGVKGASTVIWTIDQILPLLGFNTPTDLKRLFPNPILATQEINPSNPLWDIAVEIGRILDNAPKNPKAKKRVITRNEMGALEAAEKRLVGSGLFKEPKEVSYDEKPGMKGMKGSDLALFSADVPDSDVDRRLTYEQTKKAPQIAWFIRTIGDMLAELPPIKQSGAVVDIGGGRGGLSCALVLGLADRFPDIIVLAVDVNPTSLTQGRLLAAQKLPLHLQSRISFLEADASTSPAETFSNATIFVSLHACGGLSDLVLSLARRHKVPYLICQCCFPKYPALNPRMNEVPEFRTLVSLAEDDDHPELQHRAAVCVSAERLQGTGEVWMFDRKWSPRNLVLRGFGK